MRTISNYLTKTMAAIAGTPFVDIGRVMIALRQAKAEGRRVYIFGNGGSASNAQHFACDLMKVAGIRAFALTDNAAFDSLDQ